MQNLQKAQAEISDFIAWLNNQQESAETAQKLTLYVTLNELQTALETAYEKGQPITYKDQCYIQYHRHNLKVNKIKVLRTNVEHPEIDHLVQVLHDLQTQ